MIRLNGGNSSDPLGGTLTYSWRQTCGPSVALDHPNTATPSFVAPFVTADTRLCFELTVDNGAPQNNTDTDEVVVTVHPYSTPTVLLSLNASSFAVGDPLVLKLRVLTPPTGGSFPLALSWWLKLPSGERISLLYTSASLSAGFDSGELTLLDIPMPQMPLGSYEFGTLLEDPVSREDISVSAVTFEVR